MSQQMRKVLKLLQGPVKLVESCHFLLKCMCHARKVSGHLFVY